MKNNIIFALFPLYVAWVCFEKVFGDMAQYWLRAKINDDKIFVGKESALIWLAKAYVIIIYGRMLLKSRESQGVITLSNPLCPTFKTSKFRVKSRLYYWTINVQLKKNMKNNEIIKIRGKMKKRVWIVAKEHIRLAFNINNSIE